MDISGVFGQATGAFPFNINRPDVIKTDLPRLLCYRDDEAMSTLVFRSASIPNESASNKHEIIGTLAVIPEELIPAVDNEREAPKTRKDIEKRQRTVMIVGRRGDAVISMRSLGRGFVWFLVKRTKGDQDLLYSSYFDYTKDGSVERVKIHTKTVIKRGYIDVKEEEVQDSANVKDDNSTAAPTTMVRLSSKDKRTFKYPIQTKDLPSGNNWAHAISVNEDGFLVSIAFYTVVPHNVVKIVLYDIQAPSDLDLFKSPPNITTFSGDIHIEQQKISQCIANLPDNGKQLVLFCVTESTPENSSVRVNTVFVEVGKTASPSPLPALSNVSHGVLSVVRKTDIGSMCGMGAYDDVRYVLQRVDNVNPAIVENGVIFTFHIPLENEHIFRTLLWSLDTFQVTTVAHRIAGGAFNNMNGRFITTSTSVYDETTTILIGKRVPALGNNKPITDADLLLPMLYKFVN